MAEQELAAPQIDLHVQQVTGERMAERSSPLRIMRRASVSVPILSPSLVRQVQ